jgi:hypothetical protein
MDLETGVKRQGPMPVTHRNKNKHRDEDSDEPSFNQIIMMITTQPHIEQRDRQRESRNDRNTVSDLRSSTRKKAHTDEYV